ncbi:hypothetical protein DFH09DRAFT_1068986 [Mycena vulgaris]|nr:hypothetical protein DFH09DRAFT_1068986 [Mycena vulgaris]
MPTVLSITFVVSAQHLTRPAEILTYGDPNNTLTCAAPSLRTSSFCTRRMENKGAGMWALGQDAHRDQAARFQAFQPMGMEIKYREEATGLDTISGAGELEAKLEQGMVE